MRRAEKKKEKKKGKKKPSRGRPCFLFGLDSLALVPRLLPQETAFLLRRRGTVTGSIHATARKTRPWRRQRERASGKKGRHQQFLDVVVVAVVFASLSSSPHFVPATAPPPLTRPGSAAAMLVDAAAAEAAAVQATWRRLERDARREREKKKREKEKSSSAQLALSTE